MKKAKSAGKKRPATLDRRAELMKDIAHKIDRRNELARRNAPEEWLDRYDEEIQDAERELAKLEAKLDGWLLDR